MKAIVCSVAAVLLLTGTDRALSDDGAGLEPWAQQCTIKQDEGRYFIEADARALAGGIKLLRIKKLPWSPLVDGAPGVLVLHPVSPEKPARITYRFSALEARGKGFFFKARGSNIEPGVSVKFYQNNKLLAEERFDRKWETFRIPATDLALGSQEIEMEIHPVEWNGEYVYIDDMGFE